ncbi:hypothetical protein DJ010_12725 [Nocardioides silvaticus]|uniref:JAB domain-containing protein n=1 Tax=Nocardioides silvaticus TaxID=2201891 RepID=A0A316TDP3_9ACTN|nr:hypothetical protein [Nocardioides silvaticus]PWN02573.1 hypothetical protein DJ010_12725 [Nocardioides silvaticus]
MTILRLGADAVDVLVGDAARYGALGVETGALLLTPPDDPTVTVVALAGTAGIDRHPQLLVFSSAALNPLFSYAEDNSLQLRAQLHSHRHKAFLSHTDKTGNIRVPGFIASVIPNFATPATDPATWGWWTFEDGDWQPIEPATITTHTTMVITFDADGVREH